MEVPGYGTAKLRATTTELPDFSDLEAVKVKN